MEKQITKASFVELHYDLILQRNCNFLWVFR